MELNEIYIHYQMTHNHIYMFFEQMYTKIV